MAMYESDHTQFMRDWLAKNPQEIETKLSGRALWWDRAPQTPDERQRQAAARVAQKAYYYDAN